MSESINLYDLKHKTEETLSGIYGDEGREVTTLTSPDELEQVEIVIHGDVIAVSAWDLKPSLISKYKRVLKAYYYDDVSSGAGMDEAVAYYKKLLFKHSRLRHYDAQAKTKSYRLVKVG